MRLLPRAGWTAALVVLVGSTLASASPLGNCSTESAIFIEKYTPNPNSGCCYDASSSYGYGSKGNLYVADRTLDPTCGSPEAWDTAHIQNRDYTKQAEAGWMKYLAVDIPRWQSFAESQIGNTVIGPDFGFFLTDKQYTLFRVKNVDQSGTTFTMWYYNQGWVQIPSSGVTYDANFTYGEPMGETGRFGDQTGALDHQQTLQFLKSNGVWSDWGNSAQTQNLVTGISGFYYSPVTGREYEICSTTNGCPGF